MSVAERTIYIVCGRTGEYSDRNEWLTRAFTTEEDAKDYVAFLTRKRQELGPAGSDVADIDALENAMRAFDPEYSEDYTGTSWFVSPVTLAEGRSDA
jgi:hypothetical protein